MTRMILIRHGYTGYPNGTFVGSTDVGLADGAAEKARKLGERLRSEGVSTLYTSGMKRAKGTGQAIGESLGLKPAGSLPELNEIDFGEWEMKWWEDLRKDNPEDFAKRKANPWTYDEHGMESWDQVRKRALPVIRELMKKHDGETFAVVSHGVTTRIIYAALMGLGEEEVNNKVYDFLSVLFFKKDDDKIELEKTWDVHDRL